MPIPSDSLPIWMQWVVAWAQVAAALAMPLLVWYAYETYRLRRAAENQNQSLVQPLLAFRDSDDDVLRRFPWMKFTNVGRGPAYEVSVDEHSRDFPTPSGPLRFSVRLESIRYIGVNEKETATWQIPDDNSPGTWRNATTGDTFQPGMLPPFWAFPMRVTYQDMMGRRYEQVLDVEKVGYDSMAHFSPPRLISKRR